MAAAAEMGEAVAVAVAAAGSTRAGEAGAARAPNSFRVQAAVVNYFFSV